MEAEVDGTVTVRRMVGTREARILKVNWSSRLYSLSLGTGRGARLFKKKPTIASKPCSEAQRILQGKLASYM